MALKIALNAANRFEDARSHYWAMRDYKSLQ